MQGKIRVRYECQNQELSYTIPIAYHLVRNILQEALFLLWSVFFSSAEDLHF